MFPDDVIEKNFAIRLLYYSVLYVLKALVFRLFDQYNFPLYACQNITDVLINY